MINAVVDLSHHNGMVQFGTMRAAGIQGIIHKCTEGVTYADAWYTPNRSRAEGVGLMFGAYHFGTADDPLLQANWFLERAQPTPRTLLVLDLEARAGIPAMTLEDARAFVVHVRHRTGRWPGLYSGNLIKQYLGGSPDPILSQCWLWLAQYGPKPVAPPAWPTWTMWQYTDGLSGPGPHDMPGNPGRTCDRDQFNGSLEQLKKLWGY